MTFAVEFELIAHDVVDFWTCRFNEIRDREVADRCPGLEMFQQGGRGQPVNGFREERPSVYPFTRRVLASGKQHGSPGAERPFRPFSSEKGRRAVW